VRRPGVPLAAAILALCSSAALLEVKGEDKGDKKPEQPEPPRVCVTLPLALRIGATNPLTVRGLNLTNVTALQFTNTLVALTAEIKATGKAEVPKDSDARKVGDTQVEVIVTVPANFPPGTNWFTLGSTNGVSELKPLVFLPATQLVSEKEPNGGYAQAQAIELGETVSGSIKESGDVDVYQFSGAAGTTISATIRAAALGSTLDSILTISDAANRILASNDDSPGGPDSMIRLRLPQAGVYRISLQDAHDRGSLASAYLLGVRAAAE
jgi:hypothetical protein